MGLVVIKLIIGGVIVGALYAVMSIGLSLIYGITKVFNFAYGSFFMWGGYIAWLFVVGMFQWNYAVVIIVTFVVVAVMGLLAERVSIRPLRWKPKWDMTTMFSTVGLAIFLDNILLVSFGPFSKNLPAPFVGQVNLGAIVISHQEIGVFAIAIALVILVEYFLRNTRSGMAMRAVSQSTEGSQIVGIPINKVFAYTFAISSALAGVSCILLSYQTVLAPLGGWDILIKGWVILTFGGLGSIKGTIISAFILALLESFVSYHLGGDYVLLFWLAVMLIILIVRPRGLFGSWG